MAKEKTLISIDAGMSTGLVVGTYSDTEPFKLTHFFQIEGGVEGFIKSVSHYEDTDSFSGGGTCFMVSKPGLSLREQFCLWYGEILELGYIEPPVVLAEKFTARGGANSGFAYKTRDLEPLRIEGAMLAMGLNPTWTSPAQQYFSGGDGKAKKKQAQHRWLKEKGLYVTGKMVGCDNADDVRSAIAHAIAYLVRSKHRPTIEHYFPKETDD